MYGKNFEYQVSDETIYNDISSLAKYYFADGYEFDKTNEVYKLKGNMKQGTFSEMKNEFGTYPYTCRNTSSTGSCEVLIKVNSLVSETSIKAQYYSYSSTSLDGTRTNEISSNVKMQLDNWYENNIIGKENNGYLVTNYIVDNTFCSDRSITDLTYNSGYKLNIHTRYSPYTRLYQNKTKTANLKCSDVRDRFSVTSDYGNANLTYPVALITADEVMLAGGSYSAKNENYYLHTNGYFWTMTPSFWTSAYAFSFVNDVYPEGIMASYRINSRQGIRSVINIRPDVLISCGDGTMDSPYQLRLK